MSQLPPWQPYTEKLNTATEELFVNLNQIWDVIGIKENARQTYYEQVHSHIQTLMKDMLREMGETRDKLCRTITLLLKEVNSLSRELKCDAEISDCGNAPLIDVQCRLQNQAEELRKKKEQRLKYFNDLREKERVVCEALGIQPIAKNDELPSYEELENFKFYLEKQEAEMNRLKDTFNDMRRSILNTMDELSCTPEDQFQAAVCSDDENFVYTARNMVKLRELRDNLKERLEKAKEKAASKREELIALWKYLEVPADSYRKFLEKYPGHGPADLHAMNEEIRLCKEKRSENIAKYVEKVREELRELWDMCRYDEEQRKKFKPYYFQTYDESVLDLHDLEVERLREYYNKNRKLFELLTECENMWEKGKELDQRANDPERLHNRGGQLLIEEKERKLIQKKLPKLEEQINTMIKEYEAENGEPFTINGMSCDQFFMRSVEDYAEMKEHLKKQRLAKAKDKSLRKTPIMSTSRRTPATTTSTLRAGYTSVKKRDEKSPLGNSAKRNRMAQSEKARPTLCTSTRRRSDRARRRLVKAMNTSQRSAKKTDAGNATQTTIGSVTQYEQFQEHLEGREELRSSLLPEQLLKNARGKAKMRTPVKTPVKPLRKNISVATTPNKTPKSSHSRDKSKSPRLTSTPRLVAAPSKLPFFF